MGRDLPWRRLCRSLTDRFAQHGHFVDIDADSWRNKEATERAARKKPRS